MSVAVEAPALDRVMDSISRCLSPEGARRLLELRADPELQARIEELADKCTEGELTPTEQAEYELYIQLNYFVAILQNKARRLVAQSPQA